MHAGGHACTQHAHTRVHTQTPPFPTHSSWVLMQMKPATQAMLKVTRKSQVVEASGPPAEVSRGPLDVPGRDTSGVTENLHSAGEGRAPRPTR